MEIGKTELKKILKEQREEFQMFIGALVEDFTFQVKLLAESVSDLQRQLISLREMVAKNTRDIEAMKVDILVIKEDVESIKYTLKKGVYIDEFAALEKRVLILERNR